ncbi:MAG: substrate-binding domain-containing protein, partial [Lachnospiraceae bacterium]
TIQGGYDSMVKLLGKKQVTAVFVTNYEMTLGTILALNDKNIKIPEEMSIIGFDNLQLAQVVKPRLTIVTQPWEEIGRYAAELILRRMKNPKEDEKAKVVTLATELETAESVFSIQL